jgi:stringent starvation protein B
MPSDGQKPAAGDSSDAAAPASSLRGPRLTLTESPNAKAQNTDEGDDGSTPPEPPAGGRPSLKRVK